MPRPSLRLWFSSFSYLFHRLLLDRSIPQNQDSDLEQNSEQNPDQDKDQRPDQGIDIDQHTDLDQELVPDLDIGTAIFRICFIDFS